jgi:hypothetical protein
MGLDQYAYSVDPRLVEGSVDFKVPDGSARQIAYWRKHPDLQGWMQELYLAKGGQEEFNCVNVRLELEDLDALEEAVRDGDLPRTSGFFFGESTPDDRDDDLIFIRDARAELAEGRVVYYTSWW